MCCPWPQFCLCVNLNLLSLPWTTTSLGAQISSLCLSSLYLLVDVKVTEIRKNWTKRKDSEVQKSPRHGHGNQRCELETKWIGKGWFWRHSYGKVAVGVTRINSGLCSCVRGLSQESLVSVHSMFWSLANNCFLVMSTRLWSQTFPIWGLSCSSAHWVEPKPTHLESHCPRVQLVTG